MIANINKSDREGNKYFFVMRDRRISSQLVNEELLRVKCNFCDDFMEFPTRRKWFYSAFFICDSCRAELKRKFAYNTPTKVTNIIKANKDPEITQKVKDLIEKYGNHYCWGLFEELDLIMGDPCIVCGKIKTIMIGSGERVCDECAWTIPNYEEVKDKRFRKIMECDRHGYYFAARNYNVTCPKCAEEIRTMNCVRCGVEFVSSCDLSNIKAGMITSICDDCFNYAYENTKVITDVPKDFISPSTSKKMICRYCDICDDWFLFENNFSVCPRCRNTSIRFKNVCQDCGDEFYSTNDRPLYCNSCKERRNTSDNARLFELISRMDRAKLIPTGNEEVPGKSHIESILVVPFDIDFPDEAIEISKDIRDTVNAEKIASESKITKKFLCERCGREFLRKPIRGFIKYCGRCFNVYSKCFICNKNFIMFTGKKGYTYCSFKCHGSHSARNMPKTRKYNLEDIRKAINALEVEDIEDKRIEITNENAREFDCGGVWYVEDEYGRLLNVHQTSNIFNEFKNEGAIIRRYMRYGTTTERKIYEYMDNDGIDLSKLRNYIFQFNDDESKRFELEMNCAINRNALYWRPAPGKQSADFWNAIKEQGIKI